MQLINLQPDSSRDDSKSEMKKKLQMKPQKYKGLEEITMNNYMPVTWAT